MNGVWRVARLLFGRPVPREQPQRGEGRDPERARLTKAQKQKLDDMARLSLVKLETFAADRRNWERDPEHRQ